MSVSHASFFCPIKLVSHGTTPTHTHTNTTAFFGWIILQKSSHHIIQEKQQSIHTLSLARFLQIYYAAVSLNRMKWKVKPRSWNNTTHTFTIFMCPRCWLGYCHCYLCAFCTYTKNAVNTPKKISLRLFYAFIFLIFLSLQLNNFLLENTYLIPAIFISKISKTTCLFQINVFLLSNCYPSKVILFTVFFKI